MLLLKVSRETDSIAMLPSLSDTWDSWSVACSTEKPLTDTNMVRRSHDVLLVLWLIGSAGDTSTQKCLLSGRGRLSIRVLLRPCLG